MNAPKLTKRNIYLLLIVIFLIYVAAGGAQASIGSAWPAISADIGVPSARQGINIAVMYLASSLGALIAQNLVARFGSWLPGVSGLIVLAISTMVFSIAHSYALILVCGAVMGFCIGLESPIINGYVSRNYSAGMMSWLHCFFGVGCTVSPAMIAFFINSKDSWRMGFQAVVILIVCIVAILIVSVKLWSIHEPLFPHIKRSANGAADHREAIKAKSPREIFKLPGGISIPVTTFIYISFEVTIFFWATSFLTEVKGMTPGQAAGIITLFYAAQVIGRFGGGFLTIKFTDRQIIRAGLIISLASSIACAFVPDAALPVVFIVVGLSTGPTFPMLIHEVPSLVEKENAQGFMGLQLSFASLGGAVIPLLESVFIGKFGFWLFPVFLILLSIVTLVLKSFMDKKMKPLRPSEERALR